MHPQCFGMCTLGQIWCECALEVCKAVCSPRRHVQRNVCAACGTVHSSRVARVGTGEGNVFTPDSPGKACPAYTKPILPRPYCGDFAPRREEGIPQGCQGGGVWSTNAPQWSPPEKRCLGGEGIALRACPPRYLSPHALCQALFIPIPFDPKETASSEQGPLGRQKYPISV